MKLNNNWISIIFLIVVNTCLPISCNLIFDRFEYKILDKTIINNVKHEVIRFNRSMYYLNLDFQLNKPFDNRILIVYDAYAETGNEYRKIFTSSGNKFCDFTQNDVELYNAIVNSSNFPPIGTCPMPPESYSIKEFPLPKLNAAAIFNSYDYWKLYGRVLKGNRRMATFISLFKVDRY